MARKVRLFVVEGDTDETALGLLLERLTKPLRVDFDVFRSDIFGHARLGTGEDPVMREADILKRVNKEVNDHISHKEYGWNDLDSIVILTDTDGCFVPAELVTESLSIDRIRYFSNHIESPFRDTTIANNAVRRTNILRVVGRGHIKKGGKQVPLLVYYLSRNLEHALHGEAGNLTNQRKGYLAREFAARYKDNPESFVAYLREELPAAGDYQASWEHIQKGSNSLERGSNLSLLFE